jgi:uncharacterized protein
MIGKLNEEEMDQLLHQNILGRLGCRDGEQTYVVPVNYVYDGRSVIGHSLPGKKITLMRQNPQVCFEVDEMITLTRWKSVIIQGSYQELTEERDRYYAMKEFVERTMHLKISETALPPEISEMRVHPRSPGNIRPIVYRILIGEKTGRFEID